MRTSDGHVAQAFRWSDPDDDRDPQEVLTSDGLHFNDAVGDPEQKLDAEDLLALLIE